jgi:hypothetical protein
MHTEYFITRDAVNYEYTDEMAQSYSYSQLLRSLLEKAVIFLHIVCKNVYAGNTGPFVRCALRPATQTYITAGVNAQIQIQKYFIQFRYAYIHI